MSCGCTSNYDGTSEAGYMDSFDGETPAFVPELNFEDLDNVDDGRMDFRFNDDGEEFDNFLTKRSRARLKARRNLRKQGLSKKEAREQALKMIPKEKIGKVIKNALKGETSEETERLIAQANSGTPVMDVPPMSTDTPMPNQMGGGMQGGTQPQMAGVGGNKKTMLIIAGVGVLVVGGYFLFGKKLGLRK